MKFFFAKLEIEYGRIRRDLAPAKAFYSWHRVQYVQVATLKCKLIWRFKFKGWRLDMFTISNLHGWKTGVAAKYNATWIHIEVVHGQKTL